MSGIGEAAHVTETNTSGHYGSIIGVGNFDLTKYLS